LIPLRQIKDDFTMTNNKNTHRQTGLLQRLLLPEIRFVAGLYLILMLIFAVLRGMLLLRNSLQATGIEPGVLAKSFLVGMRFDIAISSYLLIPFFLCLVLFPINWRKGLSSAFCCIVGFFIFSGLAEIEFYRELEMRFNTLVFEYLSHPKIVAGMVWEGYPVFRYLLIWALLFTAFCAGFRWLSRKTLPSVRSYAISALLTRAIVSIVFIAIMVIGARGGLANTPLRWGDAFFSEDAFANNLALNGVYTLGRSALDKLTGGQQFWLKAMPREEALQTTKAMLFQPHEKDLSSAEFPLLRQENKPPTVNGPPVNVVVILIESFSGRHIGALGAPFSLTPDFDVLSGEGVLFDHAFSNGTHTHQGVFAAFAGFPNLPGYEYLMKTMEAHQPFSGITNVLERLGYGAVFLYNGLFSWDNKEGFFRQHGINRFIGRNEFVNPTFVDPVWGVSDYDVFMRANEEFRALAEQGPFFGAILTLSNHSPFNLPDPLPFEKIHTGDSFEGRANSMRYADWALGEFFKKARQEKYFANTLFVVTGDHGFGTAPAITGMQLDRFHVPLLFYSPQRLLPHGERRSTVASQVDIGPTGLGLSGSQTPLQAWGRNLLAISSGDQGFAVIKPSGGKEEVALIEGNLLLMRTPKEKPVLYRYSLGFPPGSERVDDPQKIKEMDHRLKAYVETGLLNLRERHIGIPK
jgi:phosphoglycerol transferase MdoB-like AlkP superfamily enzyme